MSKLIRKKERITQPFFLFKLPTSKTHIVINTEILYIHASHLVKLSITFDDDIKLVFSVSVVKVSKTNSRESDQTDKKN